MVVTFILSNDPKTCASLLDKLRLNKQKLECTQIINIIENLSSEKKGFKSHPIIYMWKNNIDGLKYYCNCIIDEWVKRGYNNTTKKFENVSEDDLPWWYKNKQIQYSHMASLHRKNPEHYSSLFTYPKEYYSTGYIWTGKLTKEQTAQMMNGVNLPLNEICAPIGTGAPAQFRVTEKETKKWSTNKLVNPRTGRSIKEGAANYKMFSDAHKHYTNASSQVKYSGENTEQELNEMMLRELEY